MFKKNQFVLIFLTLVTILAVWYIKTPTTVQSSNNLEESMLNVDDSNSEVFNELRDTLRNERSTMVARYDDVIADSKSSMSEITNAINSKTQLNSINEKERLLEKQVINLGYQDAFVHASSTGIDITVISEDVSVTKANEIILMTLSSFNTDTESVIVKFTSVEDFK